MVRIRKSIFKRETAPHHRLVDAMRRQNILIIANQEDHQVDCLDIKQVEMV